MPDTAVGLLIVDGELVKVLEPGLHAFWKYQRALKTELVENPTLLRLKELETLEKVTEKIDKLTVFGGLEGVLKDVVRIRTEA